MSNIDPKLRRLSEFLEPERAIPQLEQNVADALARIQVQALAISTPTSKQTVAFGAVLGQTVVVNGTSVQVTLPIATAINAGQRVTVELQGGAASVIVPGTS